MLARIRSLVKQEDTMYRERVLKIILVAVGLLFTAGIYPLVGSLLHLLIRIVATL